MATLLYSLAGEGRGHATRVRAMVEHLRRHHRVVLLTSGQAYDFLAPLYRHTDVEVLSIPGLFFHYDSRGVMAPWATALGALPYLRRWPRLVDSLCALIDREQPDLAISDFEPGLPAAAQRCGLPFVSLSHQFFLVVNDLSRLPRRLRFHGALMGALVERWHRGQVATIVSSFHAPPLRPGWRGALQVGTLLRPEVSAARPRDEGHLVVYVRRTLSPALETALHGLDLPVRVYGLGASPARAKLSFHAVSESGFLADLASCSALISTAGNQLVGEALHLGKPVMALPEAGNWELAGATAVRAGPVMALPEAGNWEQEINAWFLQDSGAGVAASADRVRVADVRAFLERLPELRAAMGGRSFDGTAQALEAVESQLHRPAHAVGPVRVVAA